MMPKLFSLHATLAAANKATQHQGKRGSQHSQVATVALSSDTFLMRLVMHLSRNLSRH
jgi:hypothetical protein